MKETKWRKFQKISGTSQELFGASGTRNTGHLRHWRNLQQASHALETLRLESSAVLFFDGILNFLCSRDESKPQPGPPVAVTLGFVSLS